MLFKGVYSWDFTPSEAYDYIVACLVDRNTLEFVELKNGHLEVRCPFSGEYLYVTGTDAELQRIHKRLLHNGWYRTT